MGDACGAVAALSLRDRGAPTGVAPQERWLSATTVAESDVFDVPPTNQPSPPQPTALSANTNQRWREGHSNVSIYLVGQDGWMVPEGSAPADSSAKNLHAFVKHEISKVNDETYFYRIPQRDERWVNKQRMNDLKGAIVAAHDAARIALPDGATWAEMQLRVMAKLFVVLHLRALDAISDLTAEPGGQRSDRFVNICNSIDLESLVENVHHMLVYRTEVKMAKKRLGSPIADGIRTQYDTNSALTARLVEKGYPAGHDPTSPDADFVYANPPMLPMFCSAPPRMGKSAVALLVSSLAVKLGGRVFYGVAPNKVVPVQEMIAKVHGALQWTPRPIAGPRAAKRPRVAGMPPERTTGQSLLVNENGRPLGPDTQIVFYSHHVPTAELDAVMKRIKDLVDEPEEWVLHVRDEAQFLVKDSSYYYKVGKVDKSIPEYEEGWRRPPGLLESLRATYPLMCGLSLCVSATLLPVLTEEQLVGHVPYELWRPVNAEEPDDWEAVHRECDKRDHRAARKARAQNAPRTVAVLSPQRGNLVLSDETPNWIRAHYPDIDGVHRSYHGTMEHVRPWKAANERDVTYMSEGMWELDGESIAANLPELKHQLALVQAKGDDSLLGMPRVYSPVVYAPTADAAAVLSHAREWLEERELGANVQGTQGALHTFHPMYLLSPTRTQRGDGGTADWVQQIFKLAWLRMHRAFRGGSLSASDAQELRKHYGMIALVYANDENDVERRRYSRSLQSGGDGKEGELLVYCFDPVDPENRLGEHAFGTLEPGKMRRGATSLYVDGGERERLNKRMASAIAQARAVARQQKQNVVFPAAELARMLNEKLRLERHEFDPEATRRYPGTPLVNLNGIVLKLTATRHENAQSAISYYQRQYGIQRVLVSGYSMLSAGLTLQHSKYTPGPRGAWEHWVPKYFAVATVRKQLSLSESYQLVGRSFVDLRGGARLPPDWKVQLLAAPYVIPVLTLYSRLELRFAMLRDMPLAQVLAHLSQFCRHPAIAVGAELPENALAQLYLSQLSRQERKDGLVWRLLRLSAPPVDDEEIEFTSPEPARVVGAATR